MGLTTSMGSLMNSLNKHFKIKPLSLSCGFQLQLYLELCQLGKLKVKMTLIGQYREGTE